MRKRLLKVKILKFREILLNDSKKIPYENTNTSIEAAYWLKKFDEHFELKINE